MQAKQTHLHILVDDVCHKLQDRLSTVGDFWVVCPCQRDDVGQQMALQNREIIHQAVVAVAADVHHGDVRRGAVMREATGLEIIIGELRLNVVQFIRAEQGEECGHKGGCLSHVVQRHRRQLHTQTHTHTHARTHTHTTSNVIKSK